jgi:hypothetical protein
MQRQAQLEFVDHAIPRPPERERILLPGVVLDRQARRTVIDVQKRAVPSHLPRGELVVDTQAKGGTGFDALQVLAGGVHHVPSKHVDPTTDVDIQRSCRARHVLEQELIQRVCRELTWLVAVYGQPGKPRGVQDRQVPTRREAAKLRVQARKLVVVKQDEAA